jgi:hypothetical protein
VSCLLEGSGVDGVEGSDDTSVGSGGLVTVLGAEGKVEDINLVEELLLLGEDVVALGLGLGGGNSVVIETHGTDLTAELLAGLKPVGLLDGRLDQGLDALGGLLDVSGGKLGVLLDLGHTIALALVEVKVTGLVDDVETLADGLAVIDDVHLGGLGGSNTGVEEDGGGEEGGGEVTGSSAGSDTAESRKKRMEEEGVVVTTTWGMGGVGVLSREGRGGGSCSLLPVSREGTRDELKGENGEDLDPTKGRVRIFSRNAQESPTYSHPRKNELQEELEILNKR